MRIKLLILTFVASFVVVPSALAQNTTVTSRQEKRIEVKERIASKQAEIRQRLNAVKRERIRNHFGKMIVRIEATIERLEKLISRIENRIKIIKDKEEDINTTNVEKTVSESKVELEKAKADLSTLKTNFETMLDSEDPKEEFKNVKDSLKNIVEHLKSVHNLLVHLIGDIKGLRVGDLNNEE